MELHEIKKELASYVEDFHLFNNSNSVFCICCHTNSGDIVMVRDDMPNHVFDSSFYKRATQILSRKYGSPPVNTFTWFCSINCMAKMIHANQLLILEHITSV